MLVQDTAVANRRKEALRRSILDRTAVSTPSLCEGKERLETHAKLFQRSYLSTNSDFFVVRLLHGRHRFKAGFIVQTFAVDLIAVAWVSSFVSLSMERARASSLFDVETQRA